MSFTFPSGPTISVLCAFSSNPLDASYVWTDITAYVRKVHIHRGRSRELDNFGAGVCSIVCSNSQRTFDPEHGTGPYYGYLLPMKPIQIVSNYASTTNYLFTGFVDGWPQAYAWNADSTVEITATDGQKVLQNAVLPASLYEMALGVPTLWWKLNEQSGKTLYSFGSSLAQGTYYLNPTLAVASPLSYDGSNTCISLSGREYALTSTITLSTSTYSVEGWFKTSGVVSNATGHYLVNAGGSTGTPFVYLMGTAQAAPGTLVANNGAIGSATRYDDSALHHYAVTDDGTTCRVYVDGAQTATGSSSASTGGVFSIGMGHDSSGALAATGFVGSLAHVVYWDGTVLSASQVLAHYNAGVNGLTEKSGTRIGRVLDFVNWPTANRNIDTGQTTLEAHDLTAAQSALAYTQTITQTEYGNFFFLGNGNPRFIARHSLISSTAAGTSAYTTSQATFGDAAGELEYASFTTQYDDQDINNDAQVTRTGGVTQLASDTSSQASYGKRTITRTGYHQNDNEAQAQAQWLVAHRKAPYFRVRSISVRPASNPTNLYPKVLGLDLMHKITVNRRPQGVGSVISKNLLIQSIDHSFGADLDWTTTYELSPSDPETNWLILDDTTYGKLDSNKLGY